MLCMYVANSFSSFTYRCPNIIAAHYFGKKN